MFKWEEVFHVDLGCEYFEKYEDTGMGCGMEVVTPHKHERVGKPRFYYFLLEEEGMIFRSEEKLMDYLNRKKAMEVQNEKMSDMQ